MSRILETLIACYASAPGNTVFSTLKPTTSKPVSQANIRVEVILSSANLERSIASPGQPLLAQSRRDVATESQYLIQQNMIITKVYFRKTKLPIVIQLAESKSPPNPGWQDKMGGGNFEDPFLSVDR